MICAIFDILLVLIYYAFEKPQVYAKFLKLFSSPSKKVNPETLPTTNINMVSTQNQNDDLINGYKKAYKGSTSDDKLPRLDFEFDNLSLKLPTGKTILNGVSGSIRSGRVTAIMGTFHPLVLFSYFLR